MRTQQDLIREMHAAAPPRAPEDPLRSFLSEVVLRDHARLLKVTLRKLHPGERIRPGDLHSVAGALARVPWRLWGRRTAAPVLNDVYRLI